MLNQYFKIEVWSRFVRICDINSILGSVVPLAMFFSLDASSRTKCPWTVMSARPPTVLITHFTLGSNKNSIYKYSMIGPKWTWNADWNKHNHNSTVPTITPKPCWIGIRKRRRRTPWCMKRVCSDFLINCETWIMTLRSSDLQSDSDLDSIHNSCDVCFARKQFEPWFDNILQCKKMKYDTRVHVLPGNKWRRILGCWEVTQLRRTLAIGRVNYWERWDYFLKFSFHLYRYSFIQSLKWWACHSTCN